MSTCGPREEDPTRDPTRGRGVSPEAGQAGAARKWPGGGSSLLAGDDLARTWTRFSPLEVHAQGPR